MGGLSYVLGHFHGTRWARRDIEAARRETKEATERLIYAAKDGYLVPPADAVAPMPTPAAPNQAADPLPEQLRELVDRWDRPETRHLEEERIRMKLSQGYSPLAILKDYEG